MSPSLPRPRRIAAAGLSTLAAVGLLLAVPGAAAAAPPRVVAVPGTAVAQPCGNPGAGGICSQLTGGGTAAVVDDRRAQLGRGHLRLTTPTPGAHATVFTTAYVGRRLADITDLEYRTLLERTVPGNPAAAPSINIQIAPRKAGVGFSTLVWEPVYTGRPVVAGRWQTWSPSTAGGGWWATRTVTATGTPNAFGFPTYTATFTQVKNALPDAVVGLVGVNQGSGSPGLVAGADGLRVNGTTYDFENPYAADLALSVPLPRTVRAGQTITVPVTATNAGPVAATKVTVAVTVQPGLRVLAAPGAFVAGGRTVIARIPRIEAGRSATLPVTLVVEARPGATVWLSGAVLSEVPDPRPRNNVARPTVAVTP